LLTKFPSFATSGRHNYTMITDRRKFSTKLKLILYEFSIFTVRINSVFPLGYTFRTRKVPTQIFGNVRCPVLHFQNNSMPQCWCCLARQPIYRRKADWIGNWKWVMRQITLTSLSRRHATLGIVKCRK